MDWEFAYAALAQFSFNPPWWLLLKRPQDWAGGYASWMGACESRLDVFLRALEGEEKKLQLRPGITGDMAGLSRERHVPLRSECGKAGRAEHG